MSDELEKLIREFIERFLAGEWPNVIVHSDPDWVMWILTFLGIVITGTIAWLTLRANKRADASRSVADAAAVRATEALAQALNLQQDTATAHIAALREIIAGLPVGDKTSSPTTDVKWNLERDVGKGRWLIRNVGTATAHEVKVTGLTEQDMTDLHVFTPNPGDVEPYAVVMFLIERSLASPPVTALAVDWTDELGQKRVWHVAVA